MKDRPTISTITPFLDVKDFLPEAIESVVSQSWPEWELILVDDGSSDGSTDIARDYAARYPGRIVYCDHPGHRNMGTSASRNLGRSRATGEWIAYLDADDVWIPSKLAEQLAIVERHPQIGLIVGATRYWYSWTGAPEDAQRDEIIKVGAPQDEVFQQPRLLEILYPLGEGAAPSMNTVLVRADALDRIGGWEDSFKTAYEDQAFLVKLYLETSTYVSSAVWDHYRQRPGSNSELNLKGTDYAKLRLVFLEWFEGYLKDRQLQSAPAWPLVQRGLRPYRHPLLHRIDQLGRRAVRTLGRI
jgi:glycosyltransferase involved in cell wall biosynthesis